MQLVVDVGNTETVVGLMEGAELRHHWRLSTGVPRTPDEYSHLLRSLLGEVRAGSLALRGGALEEGAPGQGAPEEGVPKGGALEWAALASVVPETTDVLRVTLERLVSGAVHVIDPDSPLPIVLDVEEPRTVGADRIVNTLAARDLYGRDTIAVDLGTATTFDLITAEGVFMGGVIAPGVSAGLEWLARRTAKLPHVEFRPPDRCIGRRTETCIQSGVFYSAVDAVDGIVRRIRAEWARPDAFVVATGGRAAAVAPHCTTVEHVEPFLTLFGLAIAGRHLEGSGEGSGSGD